jgi:serine/threonine protein kinase
MDTPDRIGRYHVEHRLGTGGFCTVWLGRDPELEAPIAIKVLSEQWVTHLDVRDRFLQEARMLRRAKSPRVVDIHDIGKLDDGRPYFVMEYANGGTLADAIERTGGKLPIDRALRLAAEAAYAVAALHVHQVLHRDIKPANLLIKSGPDDEERVLIADLGLAKSLATASTLTQTAGTPGYMAPEQDIRNADEGLDQRADVYGIGALAYTLLTGQVPGRPGAIRPLNESRRTIPSEVRRAVAAALAADRTRRPESAEALARVFADAAARHHRPSYRSIAIASAIALLVGGGGVVLWRTGERPADRATPVSPAVVVFSPPSTTSSPSAPPSPPPTTLPRRSSTSASPPPPVVGRPASGDGRTAAKAVDIAIWDCGTGRAVRPLPAL